LEHIDVIRGSPSEVYHYALPFSPSSSWLRECYSAELSREVKVVRGLQAEWGTCSHTVSLEHLPEALTRWEDLIAVGLQSGDITILDAIAGIRTSILPGHADCVRSLAFSSDGRFLVSGSNDKSIKHWDIQTGGVVKTIYGHAGRVCSVSISPDRTTIASGSDDKTLRLWDVQTGECRFVMDRYDKSVDFVSFSPTNPRLLLSACNHIVQQWDVDGCKIGPAYKGDDVVFSSDGTHFVSWSKEIATVRNTDSGAFVAELRSSSGWFECCRFSPDGKLVAGVVFRIIYVWDITGLSPRLIKTFATRSTRAAFLAFSSSLVSLSTGRSIKFWQIRCLVNGSSCN
jgi:WD40 repeat protein